VVLVVKNRKSTILFIQVLEESTASIFRVKSKLRKQALLGSCFHSFLFEPEDVGSTFLQNVGRLLPDYIASRKVVLFKTFFYLTFVLMAATNEPL
jgi:hypothetical protein